MRRWELTDLVARATDALEGKIRQIDKETGLAHHEVLYGALDALERATEYLSEGKKDS